MKTKILLFIFILSLSASALAQTDYFLGGMTCCKMPADSETKKLFDLGLDCIRMNKYVGAANKIYQDLIKKDSTFCDAWFLAGYTFRLSNMNKEAMIFYYMADSLAQNKSFMFKQNLAAAGILNGNIKLARKKYKELTTFFPNNSEGYYGVALTSTMIGDIEYGLENINIAEEKQYPINKDTQFLKAVLLGLNGKHQDALGYFDKVESKFSRDDNFNGSYALSLYEVATLNNDEKMLKKARKHFDKVKDKTQLTDYVKEKFGYTK